MPSLENRPSTARRDASGRKTRPPGRCSGGSPQSPFLHFGQQLSSPLSRGHQLGFLHYALAVVFPPYRAQSLRRGRPPHSLLGERPFTVTIDGLPRQWHFLLAAVSFPILGVDFLRHHSLAVDVANLRLFSSPPAVGPGAADQGFTTVKAPSGSLVPAATAGPYSYVSGAVTPGRSYADAVRSLPGASPPAQPGVLISAGGSPPPSPSPAVAATAGNWPEGRAGAPPYAAGSADWLAALQRQFPQVFFQDAATFAAAPPTRSAAHHPDNRPTSYRQIPAARPGAFGCRQA